jgi:hypothetical protein
MTPSSRSPKAKEANALVIPDGMKADEITIRPIEDETERAQRLRKDYLSFIVKDLLATCVAMVVIVSSAAIALVMLARSSSSLEERRFAITIVSSTLTALVGFVYGKAVK